MLTLCQFAKLPGVSVGYSSMHFMNMQASVFPFLVENPIATDKTYSSH